MPYPVLQSIFDGLFPKGLQWYWKGDFVKTLPDKAIEAHLAHAATLPSVFSMAQFIARNATRLLGIAEMPLGRWPSLESIPIRAEP